MIGLEKRRLDAGRTAIDRQNARVSWIHGCLLRNSAIPTKLVARTLTCNLCEECFESPNLPRPRRTLGCFQYRLPLGLAPGRCPAQGERYPHRACGRGRSTRKQTNPQTCPV